MNKFKLSLSALAMTALMFVSCDKKIETTKAVIATDDAERTATIIVKGYAELDATAFGSEVVPTGNTVLLTAPKADFITGAAGVITVLGTYTDGVITATVPADEDGVTYTITPIDFEYDVATNPMDVDVATLKMRFSAAPVAQAVKIGEAKQQKITYAGVDAGLAYQEYVTLSGQILGEFDAEKAGDEDYEDEVTLMFYNDDNTWYLSTSTDNDGKFSVSVPKGEDILCDYDFVADRNIADPLNPGSYDEEEYQYDGTKNFGAIGADTDADINVGGGTAVED